MEKKPRVGTHRCKNKRLNTLPCSECGDDHPISYFRKNGKDRHGQQRYEGTCKYVQMGVEPPPPPKPKAKRIIEPEDENQGLRIIEPVRHETNDLANAINSIEFGQELDPSEKVDAVQRFNEFIALLRAEYGKEVGAHVYIKREDQ